jgi:multisubunit Na+/H+ antiporter MnhB subunit
MDLYASYLGAMSGLFIASAVVLLPMGLYHLWKRHGRKAVIYLALAVLAILVAAGFHFFRGLMSS